MKLLSDRVREVICELTRLEPSACEISGLEMSSLQYMELLVLIECEYDIVFEDKCLAKNYFESFEHLVNYVSQKRGK